MKCQGTDCCEEAAGAVAINVPAKRYPAEEGKCLRIVLAVALCEPCMFREMLGVKNYLLPAGPGKPGIKQIFEMMSRGKQPPDFDRVFMTKVSFESEEWLTLQRNKAA